MHAYFAKRPGLLTEQAPLRLPEKNVKKKKKISNKTNKNDNTLETTKKRNANAKT